MVAVKECVADAGKNFFNKSSFGNINSPKNGSIRVSRLIHDFVVLLLCGG